jgi:hypothetical protein
MNINAIRKLLLIKTSDVYLGSLIRQIDNQNLAAYVLESLEILEKGRLPQPNVNNIEYSERLVTPNGVDLSGSAKRERFAIRDAMGHHAARFGAAFRAIQVEKDPKKRQALTITANQHAKQFAKYQHFASHLHESIKNHSFSVNSAVRDHLNNNEDYQNASNNQKKEINEKFNLGWDAPPPQQWQRDSRKQKDAELRHHWDDSKARIDAPGWMFFKTKPPPNKNIDGYFRVFTSLPNHAIEEHQDHDQNSHHKIVAQYKNHIKDQKLYYHPERGYDTHDGMYPFEHVKFNHNYINIKDQDTTDPEIFKLHFFDNMPIFATHGNEDEGDKTLKQLPSSAESKHLWPNKLPAHFYKEQNKPHYDSVHGQHGVDNRLQNAEWLKIKDEAIKQKIEDANKATATEDNEGTATEDNEGTATEDNEGTATEDNEGTATEDNEGADNEKNPTILEFPDEEGKGVVKEDISDIDNAIAKCKNEELKSISMELRDGILEHYKNKNFNAAKELIKDIRKYLK